MKPKIFGPLRSSTTTTTVTGTAPRQQQQQHPTTKTKHATSNNNSKRPSIAIEKSDSLNNTKNNNKNTNTGTAAVSWIRHYSGTPPPAVSSKSNISSNNDQQDILNHTADDTEDSSSQHSSTQNKDVPVLSKSYVYPASANNEPALPGPTQLQEDSCPTPTEQQQIEDTWSTAAPKLGSSSTTAATNEKNLSDMIWETAEPFLAYSSAQGVKWCSSGNPLSTIFQDCMDNSNNRTKSTAVAGGGTTSFSTKDYDDTLAIVGTQEEDEDDDNKNNNTRDTENNNNFMNICNGTHQGKMNMNAMSNYCDSTTEMIMTNMQQQSLLQQCTAPQPSTTTSDGTSGSELQLPKQAPAPLLGGKENEHQPLLTGSNQATLHSSSAKHKVIISRTHEDIEVSPGHHVQIRLPPINPILKSSSIRGTASNTITSHNNNNRNVVAPTTPKSVKPREIPPILSSPSSDSNKVVPQTKLLTGDVTATEVVSKINLENNNNNDDEVIRKVKDGDAATLTTTASSAVPLMTLEVKADEAYELLRNISELTMRSSYAATDTTLHKIPENRRMAYYAVGKHHKQSGKGGNRRCYFTGKLILGGTPFYAGSVLQGLRTLVVFCLPSSIGLPDKETMLMLKMPNSQLLLSSRTDSHSTGTGTLKGLRLLKSGTIGSGSKQSSPSYISHYTQHSNNLGASTNASHAGTTTSTVRSGILSNRGGGNRSHQRSHSSTNNNLNMNSGASIAGSKSMMSRLSSLDDLSLSVEGDLDPNWSLDRDVLLKVLPPASPELLRTMATLYGEQFETLPVQVRDAKQWKLYVKFCFFSGLPIAEGEMHYKVRDDIAEQVYGEEIVLSHDVMEAATGASAEILTLPNRTVMRYLRKHYAQQCSKLDDRVFQRASWVRVAPEV